MVRGLLLVSLVACSSSEKSGASWRQLCDVARGVTNRTVGYLEHVEGTNLSRYQHALLPPNAAVSSDPQRATCERLWFVGTRAYGMIDALWTLHETMQSPPASVKTAYDAAHDFGFRASMRTANVDECVAATPALVIADLKQAAYDASSKIAQACN